MNSPKDPQLKSPIFPYETIEKLEAENSLLLKNIENKTGWDFFPCPICKKGVMWGARHPECGEFVIKLEAKAKDYEEAFEEIRDFSKPYWRNMWAEKIIGIITKTLDKRSTNTAQSKEGLNG